MVGLAVGDALGSPSEFRSRRQILDSFGPDGLTDFVTVNDPRWPKAPAILARPYPAGSFTDDTQMSVAVARALVDAGRDADLDATMHAMSARFVEWSRAPDNDRFPGETCMTGCTRLQEGVPWREAGVAESKKTGSVMRVAPIGLYYGDDRDRLLEVARASSLLTHGHPAAIEGAAAAALLVAMAVQRRPPEEMYRAIMDECAPRSTDFATCLAKLPGMLDEAPERALAEGGLGEAWIAEEAVASALYCFWRSPDDFERVVLTAVNTDGDSDTIGTLAGALAGAYNEIRGVPAAWAVRVEDSEGLRSLAEDLWRSSRER